MSAKKIRLGIVGGGKIGQETIEYAASDPRVEIVGVVESDAGRRQNLCAAHGFAGFATLEKLLSQASPEAIKICTPNFVHAEQTIACLQAGSHVLCEKPVAMNYAEARSVVQAAKASQRIFMLNFEYRQSILFSRIKQILDAGEIGEVRNLWMYESRGAFLGQPGSWRFDPKFSGGIFTEKLCHYIDLAIWFAGNACRRVHVHAGENTLPHYKLPDQVMAFFEMDEGKSFCLATHHGLAADHPKFSGASDVFDIPSVEWRQLGHSSGFRIAGTKGAVVADDWARDIAVNRMQEVSSQMRGGWGIVPNRREDFSMHSPHTSIHNQQGMLQFFFNAVSEGKALIWPGVESILAVAATVDAAELALAKREPVQIDFKPAGAKLT